MVKKGPRASGSLGNGPLTIRCGARLRIGKGVSSFAVAHREASLSMQVLCSSSISNSFRNGPSISPPAGGSPAFAPASWQSPVLVACVFMSAPPRSPEAGRYPAPGLRSPIESRRPSFCSVSRSREGTIGRMAWGINAPAVICGCTVGVFWVYWLTCRF